VSTRRTVRVVKCSACDGDHAAAPVQRDKGGDYFVCFESVAGPRRFAPDGPSSFRQGCRVSIELAELVS
jgi:hypothetical protein